MGSGKWNASEPKCKEMCSDPSNATNARVIGNKFYQAKEVEFACSDDDILIPESSRKLTCENGKWNGSLPSCKALCPILSQIRNGVINGSGRAHGSSIQFTCNEGYQLTGAASARCNDGQWSETVPHCLAFCNKISKIENGQITGVRFLEGDEISFLCNQNYVLVGEKVLGCTNTGRWNASEPKCKEKCSDPSKGTNARVIGNKFYHGKEVEFICTEDDTLIPESSRKLACENGKWNGSLPSCKASCPLLSQIRNGVINGSDRTHGSFIQFTCNGGYQLTLASSARCNDGRWSATDPRCLAICNKISSIENGQVTEDGFLEGDELSFLCNQNYVLVGEKVLRCTNTGRWNASVPKCKVICRKVLSIENGQVSGDGTLEEDTISFTCDQNYVLVGEKHLRCMGSGKWNASEPKCKEKCSDPSKGTNARVIGNEFYHGQEVEFVCSDDNILIPDSSRKLTCENGNWNGSFPLCKALCPILSKIRNGVINGADRTHGSLIQFTCNGAYKRVGASSAICNDGRWSERFPRCLAICNQISSIEDGQVIGSGFLEGDEISFLCNQNHVLVGEKFLRCTNIGRWNASEPKCKGNN
ncbi:Hypothetical predicted protein [Paramuricea clavata]|uniref:Uncharacterized protein n=1 Tax=Paramuricea clavata TaxID=317549 RepID=A0A7D9EZ84_PARCT|nr:Hypothetical predicted protein [Paramuricea clavata]